ncbi:MAG: hypothetical protein HYW81_02225, partial [Parcubacteria group bacterium]|nr:hypothetical protein [Parcubacteria group bacterium]
MMSPSNRNAELLLSSIKTNANNPYVFSARRIVASKAPRAHGRGQSERDMVREQHRTLFEYDETMQELFGGDFEEYFKVIENPEFFPLGAELPEASEVEDAVFESGHQHEEDDLLPFEDDALYRSATNWATRLHELGHLLYDHRGQRDPDVF